MRTTIRLSDELLRSAKRLAAETHRTLTAVIEDALRELLHRRAQLPPTPADLPVFHGDGVRPGVNLHSTADLLDRMDLGA